MEYIMASQISDSELDVQEQLVRIKERIEQSDKFRAERDKAIKETDLMARNSAFQAMLATAALLGAGAAIAKVFFP